MRKRYCAICTILIFVAGAVLIIPMPAWAQTENIQENRIADQIETEKGVALSPEEQLIQMLKDRASRKKAEKKREQLLATKGTIGLHLGFDNNVNTDPARVGDSYFEQYFSFNWTPVFSEHLAAEIGPWYYSDAYFDNRDTTLTDTAFKAILKYYPLGSPQIELQPGIERQYMYYQETDTSGYTEDKVFLNAKQIFWKRWSQEAKYEYSFKEYDTKLSRDINSISYMPGMAQEKMRHTVDYSLGFPISKYNCKLKEKLYKETSNDHYIDYNHVYSHKTTAEAGRSITRKLYAKVSTDYERKNYMGRTESVHKVAEYDDTYNQKLYLYYTLKKDWTLSYTLTYTKSDSNYAIYDYDKTTHVAGVYISF